MIIFFLAPLRISKSPISFKLANSLCSGRHVIVKWHLHAEFSFAHASDCTFIIISQEKKTFNVQPISNTFQYYH